MNATPSQRSTAHNQILTLGLQARRIRAELEKGRLEIPASALDDLNDLETNLTRIGEKIETLEAEHSNMLALAEVSQVVNSSLELDEVLRIVMDNIVRLTRAERGFLMLREVNGERAPRGAR